MAAKKNVANLTYKAHSFLLWQDDALNWVYSIDNGTEVSSQSKELQTALNLIYESIDDIGIGRIFVPSQPAVKKLPEKKKKPASKVKLKKKVKG